MNRRICKYLNIFLSLSLNNLKFDCINNRTKLLADEEYNVMKPKTIAAANETLAMEIKQLITDTDLKIMRKRLTRT